jgi:hypothetical protein
MHVVGHQAIRVQPAIGAREQSAEVKEIKGSIFVVKEAGRAIVPALDRMDSDAWKHEAGASGHPRFNGRAALPLTKNVVCPCF